MEDGGGRMEDGGTQCVLSVRRRSRASRQCGPKRSLGPRRFGTEKASSILDPQPSILHPRSSILDPRSSILNPQSSLLDPQSSILHPPSSLLNPQSSILHP